MHHLDVDLDGAIEWIVKYHKELEKKFIGGLEQVPSWGSDVDCQVQEYLRGLANWVRVNDCWSFESGRYFGNKGLEIHKTRIVPLLPKSTQPDQDSSPRREKVVVPLIEALEAAM